MSLLSIFCPTDAIFPLPLFPPASLSPHVLISGPLSLSVSRSPTHSSWWQHVYLLLIFWLGSHPTPPSPHFPLARPSHDTHTHPQKFECGWGNVVLCLWWRVRWWQWLRGWSIFSSIGPSAVDQWLICSVHADSVTLQNVRPANSRYQTLFLAFSCVKQLFSGFFVSAETPVTHEARHTSFIDFALQRNCFFVKL